MSDHCPIALTVDLPVGLELTQAPAVEQEQLFGMPGTAADESIYRASFG
jgi:hypothetical protein